MAAVGLGAGEGYHWLAFTNPCELHGANQGENDAADL